MSFRELFNKIDSGIKNIDKAKNKLHTAKPQYNRITNDLNQGLNYRKNKKNKIARVSHSTIIEGFNGNNDILNKLSLQEQNTLNAKINEYDRDLSKYGTAYTNFMNSYFTANEKVKSCKVECRKNYKESASVNKKKACLAGCDLKGPYVLDCKDSYTGVENDESKNCTNTSFIGNKCASGKIIGGTAVRNDLNKDENKDKNNLTPVQGCCSCGGGIGGKPKSKYNNSIITSCTDITDNTESIQKELQSICLSANVDIGNPNDIKNKYKNLQNTNKKLNNISTDIFDKYKEMKNKKNDYNQGIQTREVDNGNIIDKYAELNVKYDDLIKKNGNQLSTLDGQLENASLNRGGESMRYIVWISIAVLFSFIISSKLNK